MRVPSIRLTGPILIALIAFIFALVNIPADYADAATEGNTTTYVLIQSNHGFVEVTRHNVVVTSTLRRCPLEDGGPRVRRNGPCTWNVGTTPQGNAVGLAYVLYFNAADHQREALYVWPADPTVHGWTWVHLGAHNTDCVEKAGKPHLRCSDGRI